MAALAGNPNVPATPTKRATDLVGFMTPAGLKALDARLTTYESVTKHQVWVWIGANTGDQGPGPWCHVAFNAWGVGRKGLDDGVVLFIFKDTGYWWITVGYGLESAITDAEAVQIATETPRLGLDAGDKDKAVNDTVNAILAQIASGPAKAK